MGAKTAVKLRNRGIAYKCDICGRKLMTSDALEGHRRTAHNIITKRRGRAPIVRNATTDKLATKILPKPPKEVKIVPVTEKSQPEITKMKTTVEFECPKCFKTFPTYFPALKHIQKYHCVDSQGIPVAPHDASLIQPERLELCNKCESKVRSIHTHTCQSEVPTLNTDTEMFVCAACEEWFPNLNTFNTHVVSMHADFETLFFPSSLEFIKWKLNMEQQTGVNYSILEKCEEKMYYHCSYVKDTKETNNTNHHICPSIIDIQEFSNGLQVHFYHRHHKHSPTQYNLPPEFRKYSLSPYLARTDDYKSLSDLAPDDGDMYMQFKKLMEGIIVDAAKINVTTLKVILGKAFEIASILSNYDEEMDDISTVAMKSKQILSDNEISKILEQPLSKRKVNIPTTNVSFCDQLVDTKDEDSLKRKIVVPTMTLEVKRVKQSDETSETISSPKILNTYSLASPFKESNTPQKPKELMNEQTDINTTKTNGDDTPSSFNDSYKDFVVKNFPNQSIASRTRSKPIIKTQIGQFKPNLINKSQKKDDIKLSQPETKFVDEKNKPTIDATKSVTKYPSKLIKMVEPTKIEVKTKLAPILDKNDKEKPHFKPENRPVKKVDISRKIIRNNSRTSFEKSLKKVDFEYEVKEQADDCNILILKL